MHWSLHLVKQPGRGLGLAPQACGQELRLQPLQDPVAVIAAGLVLRLVPGNVGAWYVSLLAPLMIFLVLPRRKRVADLVMSSRAGSWARGRSLHAGH